MNFWQIIHCVFDVICAFYIIGLAIETTQHASFNGGPQALWAMYRRLGYGSFVIGLFARAMFLIEPPMRTPLTDTLTTVAIIGPVLFFLIVRKAGLVDQDRWVGPRNLIGRHRGGA